MMGVPVLLTFAVYAVLNAAVPVRASHAMVVTEEAMAADVGVAVLKSGGNAVDAAVAVGFTLAVTHPFAGNLGGGGFMLVRFADGRSTCIDFRETAPKRATPDMFLGPDGNPTRDSVDGWRASGVPGTVRGFEYAQKKYGRKTWAELLEPAVRLAAEGFRLNPVLAESLKTATKLKSNPEASRIFQNGGQYYRAGDVLRQPDLAATLNRIAKEGARGFYEGETARKLDAEMARHGGLISLSDLQNYAAIERVPIRGSYKGYTVISAPLPSAGGIGLLQMLGILEGSGYEKYGAGSAEAYHYMAEAMRRFYADRGAYLGDPAFVNNPVAKLLEPAYLRARRESIDPHYATPSSAVRPGLAAIHEGNQTVHFNVVDSAGNAVAVTYTLNDGFGSGIVVPGLGFLLNDEMDDFTASPGKPNLFGVEQGKANAIAPGKRPLSSMSPTIVLRDGKLYLLLGTPGGSRIPTAVLQVFLNVVDFGMNAQAAVEFPRIHHQWQPDVLSVERAVPAKVIAQLTSMGYSVNAAEGLVPPRVSVIRVMEDHLEGGVDPRNTRNISKAAGY